MAIILNLEQEQFIQEQLMNGQFQSPEEVIETALRLLKKCNTDYVEWIEEVRAQVQVAQAEVASGDTVDGEEFVAGILDKFQQARANTV